MRVAFDEQIFAIQPYGGISRMFAELATAFIDDPELNVNLLPLNAPIINRYVLDTERVRTRLAVWDAKHEYASFARYIMRVQPRRGQDIVHNTFYLPHGLASYPGAKRIVTIHDMIPEFMPNTRRRLDFLTLKRRYVRSADQIVCVSEATKRDLLKVYPEVTAPISVIHHGVDGRFTPGALPLPNFPDKYILFVGNRGQYKDAEVLIRSFSNLTNQHDDVHLVFVGGGTFNATELEMFKSLGLDARVHLESLTDIDMAAAYGNAQVFVFPSHFEGFGMPALEAMACGTATVLSNASSLPEVGGDAAIYFPPGDFEYLSEVLDDLLSNDSIRSDLEARGVERARNFTWANAAAEHAAVYEMALNSS